MIHINLIDPAVKLAVERRAKKRAVQRASWHRHKERLLEARKVKKSEHAQYMRAYRYKHEYGITIDQYDEMFAAQKGRCRSCDADVALVVDHDHKTGKVRGLLCGPCNQALGLTKDRPKTLRALAAYLEGSL